MAGVLEAHWVNQPLYLEVVIIITEYANVNTAVKA